MSNAENTSQQPESSHKKKSSRKAITRRSIIAAGGSAIGVAALAASKGTLAKAQQPVDSETNRTKVGDRFKDKVVLITGATSGIGRATAIAFAREGAKVVFCGRRAALGKEVQDEIRQTGGEALYVRADVTQPTDIAALIATTVKTYGRLDIAFNNAGFEGSLAPMYETTLENWDAVINTNLRVFGYR
jgi:3-oxoacyl-ACP reductase-like protein